MRKLPVLFLLFALIPRPARALAIDNLMDTIAMPLAVAAVSEVSGVQPDALSDLVTTLNQANVPPRQFVEVIRYVPVALVDQNGQPFVAYVRERTEQGVTGGALVDAMADRLRTQYDLAPALTFTEPATTYVVQDEYIPQIVETRVATLTPNYETSNPLAFIALPLAVAAVSEIMGVPQDELANLVAALNQANVPPAQIVEVVRYAPVALVADNGQPFLQFVQEQTTRVVGPALYPVIQERLQTYYPAETRITVAAPQPTVHFNNRDFNDRDFVPPVVVTRMQEVRDHPHGGPPGQLKKQLGLQTGAEIVHGSQPVREAKVRKPHRVRVDQVDRVTPQPMISSSAPVTKSHGHGAHHKQQTSAAPAFVPQAPAPAPAPAMTPAAQPHGHGQGHGHGGDKDGGKGNGGGPPQQPHGNGGGKKHGKG
jgi:hypothetical protein